MLEIDAHITSNQMYMIVKYCKREETLNMHRNNQLQVAFSRPVSSSDFVIVSSNEEEKITIKEWRSISGQKFDSLWITELDLPASVNISVKMANGLSR